MNSSPTSRGSKMELDEFLYEVDQALQERGHGPMDDDTFKEVAVRMAEPSVRKQIESGQLTVDMIVEQVEEGLRGVNEARNAGGTAMLGGGVPMEEMVEGGFVNDSSGEATNNLRQQFGIR